MTRLPDYYRVLQVDSEADPEVITAAYRALARRLHPDRDITGVEDYRMAELNRAYAVLRDPAKRSVYDQVRRLQPMGPGPEEAPRSGGLAARMSAAAAATGVPVPGQTSPDDGETRLSFGRYAGMTLREIAQQDTEYLRWLSRHSSGLRYRGEIERILGRNPQDSYAPGPSR